MKTRVFASAFLTCLLLLAMAATAFGGKGNPNLSDGFTYYVPAYSNVFYGDGSRAFLLTVTLAIHNADPKNEIAISEIVYHGTNGGTLRHIIKTPIVLKPFESRHFTVPEKDNSGGFGANFTLVWSASTPVNPPVVESVMIGAQSGQGISFTSRGIRLY